MQIAYIPFGVTAPLPTRFCAPLRKKATPRGYILISLAERGLKQHERKSSNGLSESENKK